MRGMIIGAFLGGAFAIGLVFFLDIWDFWRIVGPSWSTLIGLAMGFTFTSVGMIVGDAIDYY